MGELQTTLFTSFAPLSSQKTTEVVDFLHQHLQEYGDEKKDIRKAIAYSLKEHSSLGGFLLTCTLGDKLAGVVVINKTGMEGYIPENILVYIAVDNQMRGQGIGKKLMTETIKMAKGNIALHVEPDNPAKGLYEKLGFKNKYLEMRLEKA